MEDDPDTDTFSDLSRLQMPQEQLQTYLAAKTQNPPRALPTHTKTIGGPILVSWLVAAAEQGKDALLVGLLAWRFRNCSKAGGIAGPVVLRAEVFMSGA